MLKFDTPQTTRMAPSPTGNAHIGFARTAYLNWLAARSTGGKFILRIDDTDKERSKKEYEDNILSTMDWLGLEYDAIYRQSERFDRYREVVSNLVMNESAITHEANGPLYLYPNEYEDSWSDLISGTMDINEQQHQHIRNLILCRSDGSPTYHFASVVDDAEMGVNLIIRGTDHVSNTAKHVHIYKALRQPLPTFAHVGLIFHNGKKISKRDGLSSMDFYRENYKPEAVLNALLKLGWSHPNPKFDKEMPIITKEDAIKVFPDGQLRAAKSTLDMNKLSWLNKRY